MSEIANAFARARGEKRAAFIPYLTAGDPDLASSLELIEALNRAGADIIELGVPFSDPIADGPVNQRAAARALRSGTTLPAVLELVAKARGKGVEVPIVLFSYFNPLLARGLERFAEQAAASGVDAVLCVDLPPEEAQEEYLPTLRAAGLETPFLLAPTSDRRRLAAVGQAATGFIYYVAQIGVTGTRERLPKPLLKETTRLRRKVPLPLVVGFGIASPEQAQAVGKVADGVVVGSALVELVERHAADPQLAMRIERLTHEFVSALAGKEKPSDG